MSDDVVPTTPRKKDGGSRLDVASTFRKLNLKHSFRTLTLPKKEKKTQSVVHEEEKKQTTVQSPAQQVPSSAATTTTSTPEPEQESNHFDHEPSEPEEPTSVAGRRTDPFVPFQVSIASKVARQEFNTPFIYSLMTDNVPFVSLKRAFFGHTKKILITSKIRRKHSRVSERSSKKKNY